MNAKHTPEPWFLESSTLRVMSDYRNASVICTVSGSPSYKSSQSDGDRIVACVNACAGIEDPAELRRQRDELLNALEHIAGSCEGRAAEVARCAIENATKGTK